MEEKRNIGLDYLKIIAMAFVVVLHINGYLRDKINSIDIKTSFDIVWHIIEAIAYPAIHLFVLISCYFWIDKKPSLKNGINIYLQTFVICIIGLIIAMFFSIPFEKKELLQSIFPFSARAYWFVTDYLLLFMIAPFLKNIVDGLNNDKLVIYTIGLLIFVSIYCFILSTFGWNQEYSNISLFICLFFIAALIKRRETKSMWGGGTTLAYIGDYANIFLYNYIYAYKKRIYNIYR